MSKQLIKTVDQSAETNAIVDFDSNMDVINDKVVKAKSQEEVNPNREQVKKMTDVWNHIHYLKNYLV